MTFDDLLSFGLTKFGDIQLQLRPPIVRAAHCRHALSVARAGMVICRRFGFYADGLLIPGVYSHSGIVESAEIHNGTIHNEATVIHAIAEGVERIDLLDFVKDCDGFVLISFDKLEDEERMNIVNRARSLIGLPYDFRFSIVDSGKCLYCHETSAAALAPTIKIVPSLKDVAGIAREIFTADDFLNHPRARVAYEVKG